MVDVATVGSALEVLADVERDAAIAARRYRLTRYSVAPGHAMRTRGRVTFDDVPTRPPDPSEATSLRSRATADLVLFGKFDRPGSTRLRAFYDRTRRGSVAVKVQPWHGEGEHGIAREVAARRRVDELAPEIAPSLHGHGVLEAGAGSLGYMVEGLVTGRHPRRWEIHETAEPLVAGLLRLYRAAGLRWTPASELVTPQLVTSWTRLARERGDAEALLPRVERLLEEDRTVAIGLAHGDPVASNVVATTDGGVVLVDWEYAREGPVAGDLAKILQQAVEDEQVLATIERHVGATFEHDGSYDLYEQMALAQIRLLGWYESQREKAEAAGRTRQLARTVDQRLGLIGWMLR